MRAQGPDGHIFEFPDGTAQEIVSSVIRRHYAGSPPRPRQMRPVEARAMDADPGVNAQAQQQIARAPVDAEADRVYREARSQEGSGGNLESQITGERHAAQDYRDAYWQQEHIHPEETGIGAWATHVSDRLGVGDEIANAAARIGQTMVNAGHRMRNEPVTISAGTAGQVADDISGDRGRHYAQEHPIASGFATAAGILAAGNPDIAAPSALAVGPRGPVPINPGTISRPVSALRAGLSTAATDAPFAVARQEGDIGRRAEQAAPEIAASAVIGSTLQAGANALTRNGTRAATRAAQFEQAGVRPTLAAVNGRGAGAFTKAIGENPIGGNVRTNLQNSINDTRDAAARIAQGYGQPGQPELVGENVQAGIRRFSGDTQYPVPAAPHAGQNARQTPVQHWSFEAKANALYDDVFRDIEQAEQRYLQGQGRRIANQPRAARPLTTQNSRAVLDEIAQSVHSQGLRDIILDPQIERFRQTLVNDRGGIRFRDLRQFRTYVRNLQRRPMLRQGVDDAGLQRLEQALTQDIQSSAQRIIGPNAGPSAARRLQQVDRFYRNGSQRISSALQQFTNQGVAGAGAYQRILKLASTGGRENSRALISLKRTLQPDEWRQVVATVIDHMGEVRPSAADAMEPGAFSVASFVTNYAKLSDDGRRALFGAYGGGGARANRLMAELDNLVQVGGLQKGVEQFTNASRSGSSAQQVGTLATGAGAAAAAATGNVAPLAGWLGLLATMRVTGEALTNPGFVRWLVSAPRAGQATGGARHQLAMLAQLAARDPALAPIYTDLAQHMLPSGGGPETTPQRTPAALPQPQTSPALSQ